MRCSSKHGGIGKKRIGKSLDELAAVVKSSGLEKHGELVAMLTSSLVMGHGDANTMVHYVRKSDGEGAAARPRLFAT